jgi:hypothetical protein
LSRSRRQGLETNLVYSILDFLRARRVKAWRANTGGARYKNKAGDDQFVRFGEKGQPDIIGVMPPNGRTLMIECKSPGKKATREQLDFIDDARRCGALAFVTDSMDEAMRVIDLELKGLTR